MMRRLVGLTGFALIFGMFALAVPASLSGLLILGLVCALFAPLH